MSVCRKGRKKGKRDLMTAITVKKVRIGTGSKIKSKLHRREEMRERKRELCTGSKKGTEGQRTKREEKTGNHSE